MAAAFVDAFSVLTRSAVDLFHLDARANTVAAPAAMTMASLFADDLRSDAWGGSVRLEAGRAEAARYE